MGVTHWHQDGHAVAAVEVVREGRFQRREGTVGRDLAPEASGVFQRCLCAPTPLVGYFLEPMSSGYVIRLPARLTGRLCGQEYEDWEIGP